MTEGSGDNIFILKDGVLHTPPAEAGLLEGITRRFVLERLAPECGIEVKIRRFRLDEVLEADEIFLTGSAAEVIAVTQVDQHVDGEVTSTHKISDGEGPTTAKLRSLFRTIVTSDNIPED